MRKINLLLLGLLSLVMFSCINEEGEGGTAVVQGKVYKVLHANGIYAQDEESLVQMADTFPAAKEDVYIVYGDEPIYGDKMETGFDGFYRFKFLTKGTYRVFAYSTLTNSAKKAVIDTVTVAYGETKNVRNIYIHEGKSYNTSYIKGRVLVKNYNKGVAITTFKDAPDVRVFIRVKDAPYHFDEVRTGMNGVFMFQGLQPGTYEVFVFTQNPTTELLTPIMQTVVVEKAGTIQLVESVFETTASV